MMTTLNIIHRMLQHKDDVSSSWMEYIGFQSHNIYQQFLTDEYLYGIRDQLENILNKVGLYFNNQFLMTPEEWGEHVILFSDYTYNRFVQIREMLNNEMKILSASPPVLPIGTWRNVSGKNIARFVAIHPEQVHSIVLLDDNHELIIDENIYQDSNTFDVELLDNMKKYELIINGKIQKPLPINNMDFG